MSSSRRAAQLTRILTVIGVVAGGSLLALLPVTVASAAVVPPPAGAVIVGTASATCPAPTFATITAAVAGSPAGSTIYVCAGIYDENVVINKNVTLLGAQFGVDARTGRTNLAEETVVSSATGAMRYLSPATTGTIDGFTLQGTAARVSDDDGIEAVEAQGTGYTFIDNVITENTTGINFDASGTTPTLIQHNRITDNNAPGSSTGNGVFFTTAPVNNVTINENAFGGQGTGINTTSGSTNLAITNNTSVGDGNFVALFLANHANLSNNTVSWTNPNDPAAGSAFFVSGGNSDVTIASNTIDGGAANGVTLNNQFNGSSAGVHITSNTITRRLNGIVVAPSFGAGPTATDVTIESNTVSAAGIGDTAPTPADGGNGIWLRGAPGWSYRATLLKAA